MCRKLQNMIAVLGTAITIKPELYIIFLDVSYEQSGMVSSKWMDVHKKVKVLIHFYYWDHYLCRVYTRELRNMYSK